MDLTFGLAAAGSGRNAHWPQNIENFSTHYIGQMRSVQPRGPYRLIGHSLGGLIAYEMACELAEAGETVEFLGLLDCEAPDPARKPRRLPLARVGLNLVRTPPKVLLGRLNEQIQAIPVVRRARDETVSAAITISAFDCTQCFQPLIGRSGIQDGFICSRPPSRSARLPPSRHRLSRPVGGRWRQGASTCSSLPGGPHGDRQGSACSLDSESDQMRP